MRKAAVVLCVWAFCLLLGGCQTPPSGPAAETRRRESSIPWNRPAKWEGAGVLGSAMPQNH